MAVAHQHWLDGDQIHLGLAQGLQQRRRLLHQAFIIVPQRRLQVFDHLAHLSHELCAKHRSTTSRGRTVGCRTCPRCSRSFRCGWNKAAVGHQRSFDTFPVQAVNRVVQQALLLLLAGRFGGQRFGDIAQSIGGERLLLRNPCNLVVNRLVVGGRRGHLASRQLLERLPRNFKGLLVSHGQNPTNSVLLFNSERRSMPVPCAVGLPRAAHARDRPTLPVSSRQCLRQTCAHCPLVSINPCRPTGPASEL